MKRFALFVSLLAIAGSLSAQELTNFSFGRQAPVISPEIQADSVTFRLKADYATIVKLNASWMGAMGGTVDMKRGENNVWSVKLPLPSPEIYTYSFMVDGVSVNDPQNIQVQRDGQRFLNMLIVPGKRTENYGEANKRGTVRYMWYDSALLGSNRRMVVYTPYGYETSPKEKYPVLYLLHGGGGDEEAWTSMGRAAQILDNLIEKGLAKPMIVVMPNGNPGQQAAATLNLPTKQVQMQDAYVKSLVTEIIPFIEKNFRAIPKKESRAIAGLSMGGGHTLSASGLYPGTFGYICPLSIGSQPSEELNNRLQGIKKAGYNLYWFGVGNTDFLYQSALSLDKALTDNGLEHTFFVTDGGHTWANWRNYLDTFSRLLFK
ncbi:MAG: esterase [Bacteroidales bacterium]|nr:esterase [Bacteroidales bacterium]MBQ9174176.1 esterase [Bacteroidales bacterium]